MLAVTDDDLRLPVSLAELAGTKTISRAIAFSQHTVTITFQMGDYFLHQSADWVQRENCFISSTNACRSNC